VLSYHPGVAVVLSGSTIPRVLLSKFCGICFTSRGISELYVFCYSCVMVLLVSSLYVFPHVFLNEALIEFSVSESE
jgi:hypothetical protein